MWAWVATGGVSIAVVLLFLWIGRKWKAADVEKEENRKLNYELDEHTKSTHLIEKSRKRFEKRVADIIRDRGLDIDSINRMLNEDNLQD